MKQDMLSGIEAAAAPTTLSNDQEMKTQENHGGGISISNEQADDGDRLVGGVYVAMNDQQNKLGDPFKGDTSMINDSSNSILMNHREQAAAMDISKLCTSPTPRKSERERKNISYDKLNAGKPNSDDESSSLKDGLLGTHHHSSATLQ